jgi:dihydrofolate reductase
MARLIRYSVAMSIDGFIATSDGGYDWIPMDDEIDFAAYLAKIDTLLMGRGTFETANATDEGRAIFDGMAVFVVSTTLDPAAHPGVTMIGGPGQEDVVQSVTELKASPGKDMWLFGGGVLFRALLEAGLVDRVEVAVVPRLLGTGLPLVPGLDSIEALELHSSEAFDSGIVLLKYDVAVSG